MKEKFLDSGRVRLAIVAIVLQLLVLFLPAVGLELDQDVLAHVADWVAGLIMVLIVGRTFRNTAVSK